jgi:uncharacterized repeat protein (TIGR01451 family)
MNPLFKRTPLAAGILLALSSPVYSPQVIAAQGDTAGIEFLVNTYTTGNQRHPSIALDADGDFVIAWTSYDGQDGDSPGVYAQRYTADGSTADSEFLVNTETLNAQLSPSIAMDADGDFVIAWESSGSQDGDGFGVYAQRYTADGFEAGAEFLVNTKTSDNQRYPSIAMDADGDFVIAWQSYGQDTSDSYGVYAQRYTADGSTVGSEFLVNTETYAPQSEASIAMDADGDFVIAWQSYQNGDGYGIYAQRYSADGSTAGSEFLVNTHTDSDQKSPSVAMDADGDFVIAWQSQGQDNSPAFDSGVYAQRYSADGIKAGAEFLVNTVTDDNQQSPSVAMDADGDFVIAWESYSYIERQDGFGFGVIAQRYTAKGIELGSEFLVNTETSRDQSRNSIAMDADGDFVIAWESYLQDGSFDGVYAQRYEGASQTVDLNLVVQDDVDPVAPGGSFVYSLITTNNGTGTALDVSLSEPIPTGLTYVSDDAASVGWGCALTGATVNCSKPFMTVGETNTIQVNVKADADASGTVSNTVTVEAAQTDANAADNTDTETTVIASSTAATCCQSGFFGIGSFSLTPLLLLLPLWIRRRWLG